MIIGVALGLVSWCASSWITSYALSRAARPGPGDLDAAGAVAVFLAIAFAESPALVGLVLATVDGTDVGAIAIPVAAIVVNGSGPVAVRRHLDRLRA